MNKSKFDPSEWEALFNQLQTLNLQTIRLRWRLPTPAFWQHISRICLSVAAAGAGLLAFYPQAPVWLSSALAAAGTLGGILSRFAIADVPAATPARSNP